MFLKSRQSQDDDLMLKNSVRSFQNSFVLETGLSDFHKMTVNVLKSYLEKKQPNIISYRDFGKFSNKDFRTQIWMWLCDYSDAYIHVKGTIKVPNTGTVLAPNNRNKNVTFKNCALFINYLSEISNTQVDYAHDVVIPMYDLTEYSDTYSKTSISLWQYYRDEPALNKNVIIDFPPDNNYSTSYLDLICFVTTWIISSNFSNRCSCPKDNL